MHKLRFRQVHLDFHTSEQIPGIGSEFDADEFAATLKAAHVNSVTVFVAGVTSPWKSKPDSSPFTVTTTVASGAR